MKFINCFYLIFTITIAPAQSVLKDTSGVVIGMYEWSAHNLDVKHFRNGDAIPEAKTEEEWKRAAENGTPAWCYYNNDSTSAQRYGILYNWYAVHDPRGLSPSGWDIPTRRELQSLMKNLGSKGSSGAADFGMKAGGVRYIGGG